MSETMKQRFYIDGKLQKTTKPNSQETLRKWLDNLERDWSKNGMMPLTPIGQFDMNGAHQVIRNSPDELIVITTAGKSLRFININSK